MCRSNGSPVTPAAGKSTFINSGGLKRYVPGFKGYKVINTDTQLVSVQFQFANRHYDWLLHFVGSGQDIANFKKDSGYISNSGARVEMPITWEWWQANRDKGAKYFWSVFFKSYYASYFDLRDQARGNTAKLFATKVYEAGNLLVIDTVAARPGKIFDQLTKTRELGFHNVIVYLEVDPELCVERDKWRGDHTGRTVGIKVITDYAARMPSAFTTYERNAKRENGLVDRILHFKWIPAGDSPIDGAFKLVSDDRYGVKRRVSKRRK